MKAYIFIDGERAHVTFGRSVAEARQRVLDSIGVDAADLVRVEVSPKTPKTIEWAKLGNVGARHEAQPIEAEQEVQE